VLSATRRLRVCVGGFDLTGYSAVFEYVLQLGKTDREAARSLSGWPKHAGGLPPRLWGAVKGLDKKERSYDATFSTLMENLITILFGTHLQNGLKRDVAEVMLASFLRFGRTFIEDHGVDCAFMRAILAEFKAVGIDQEGFLNLCDVILQDFGKRNAVELSTTGEDGESVVELLRNSQRSLNFLMQRMAAIESAVQGVSSQRFYTPLASRAIRDSNLPSANQPNRNHLKDSDIPHRPSNPSHSTLTLPSSASSTISPYPPKSSSHDSSSSVALAVSTTSPSIPVTAPANKTTSANTAVFRTELTADICRGVFELRSGSIKDAIMYLLTNSLDAQAVASACKKTNVVGETDSTIRNASAELQQLLAFVKDHMRDMPAFAASKPASAQETGWAVWYQEALRRAATISQDVLLRVSKFTGSTIRKQTVQNLIPKLQAALKQDAQYIKGFKAITSQFLAVSSNAFARTHTHTLTHTLTLTHAHTHTHSFAQTHKLTH